MVHTWENRAKRKVGTRLGAFGTVLCKLSEDALVLLKLQGYVLVKKIQLFERKRVL